MHRAERPRRRLEGRGDGEGDAFAADCHGSLCFGERSGREGDAIAVVRSAA